MKTIYTLIASFTIVLSQAALALPVDCAGGDKFDTEDATANSSYAVSCYEQVFNGNPDDEEDLVELLTGLDFDFAAKYENGGGLDGDSLPGWNFEVSSGDSGYDFDYMLSNDALVGQVIDFALLIKTGENIALFVFEDITLNIDGMYNSFNKNIDDPDYSHASAFIIGGSTDIPEPAPLLLMALSLLMISRFKKRQ